MPENFLNNLKKGAICSWVPWNLLYLEKWKWFWKLGRVNALMLNIQDAGLFMYSFLPILAFKVVCLFCIILNFYWYSYCVIIVKNCTLSRVIMSLNPALDTSSIWCGDNEFFLFAICTHHIGDGQQQETCHWNRVCKIKNVPIQPDHSQINVFLQQGR